MSDNTAIEWADHTFNPWEGCQQTGLPPPDTLSGRLRAAALTIRHHAEPPQAEDLAELLAEAALALAPNQDATAHVVNPLDHEQTR